MSARILVLLIASPLWARDILPLIQRTLDRFNDQLEWEHSPACRPQIRIQQQPMVDDIPSDFYQLYFQFKCPSANSEVEVTLGAPLLLLNGFQSDYSDDHIEDLLNQTLRIRFGALLHQIIEKGFISDPSRVRRFEASRQKDLTEVKRMQEWRQPIRNLEHTIKRWTQWWSKRHNMTLSLVRIDYSVDDEYQFEAIFENLDGDVITIRIPRETFKIWNAELSLALYLTQTTYNLARDLPDFRSYIGLQFEYTRPTFTLKDLCDYLFTPKPYPKLAEN